jgi:hypothetical protein
MDVQAKCFLNFARSAPKTVSFCNKPWSLLIEGMKLMENFIGEFYDYVHSKEAKDY